MELAHTIGLTATATGSIACSPASGNIAYPAGCMVVVYNFLRDQQQYLSTKGVQKAIACVAFPAGRSSGIGSGSAYIAAGEVRALSTDVCTSS